MKSATYKLIELFIVFVLVPVSFALTYPVWIKMIIGILGFLYIIYVLLKVEKNKFKMAPNLNWKAFWKRILLHLLIIIVVTTVYVYITDKTQLFNVMLYNSKLWVFILFFYSLFSVYPQELIYRTFFFQRYQELLKSDWLFILINAALFSLAHIFFKNALVMVLTFLGGILFALTFKKTKSCWLFTVGMGEMLGFPS